MHPTAIRFPNIQLSSHNKVATGWTLLYIPAQCIMIVVIAAPQSVILGVKLSSNRRENVLITTRTIGVPIIVLFAG
jgi:hypothetical protein